MSRAREGVINLPLVSPKSAERVFIGWSRGQEQLLAQRLDIYPRSCQLGARRRHPVPDDPPTRRSRCGCSPATPRDRRQPRVPRTRVDGLSARAAARGILRLHAGRSRAPRPVRTHPAIRQDRLRPAREPLTGGRWLRRGSHRRREPDAGSPGRGSGIRRPWRGSGHLGLLLRFGAVAIANTATWTAPPQRVRPQ